MKKVMLLFSICCFSILLLISRVFHPCSKDLESNPFNTFAEDFTTRIIGMTFDSEDKMYVGTIENQAQKRILQITPNGEISTLTSIECLAISYIKVGKDDSIYVAVIIDAKEGGAKILKISRDGKISLFSDGFTQPVGMAFDFQNNMLVVDALAKKIYKIIPSKEKSVFIDLDNVTGVQSGNYYHGIDFDHDCRNLYVAGLNTNGNGNLVKFPIKTDGNPDTPVILSNHYTKHVTIRFDVVYATIDSTGLLIIDANGTQKIMNDPLLNDGMNLCFGSKKFVENTLYINSFDKIIKMTVK